MTPTGAAVTIKVRRQPDGDDWVQFSSPARKHPIELTLEGGTLAKAREDLSDYIAEFKEKVVSKRPTPLDAVRAAFTRLFETTCLLASHLAEEGSGELDDLRRFFEDAMPGWRDAEDDVPLIEVDGPIDGFPFEWLPMLDFDDPGSIEDIEVFARRFLGFAAVVRRTAVIRKRAGGDPGLAAGQSLQNKDGLPVTFAWFAEMTGAQQERAFFERLGDHIELNGPWPSDPAPTPKQVLDTLTDALFNPRRRFDKPDGDAIQIAHFACHCDTHFKSPVDYQLILGASNAARRAVSIGKLNMGFLGRQKGAPKRMRPLVFLNACESAKRDTAHVFSWPEWFLRERHVGVIGTETLVPDRVAARYSELFYTELLGGRKLGEALVIARRRLLHEGNPLGLLYVLYADPDMTVENPIPKETLHG